MLPRGSPGREVREDAAGTATIGIPTVLSHGQGYVIPKIGLTSGQVLNARCPFAEPSVRKRER